MISAIEREPVSARLLYGLADRALPGIPAHSLRPGQPSSADTQRIQALREDVVWRLALIQWRAGLAYRSKSDGTFSFLWGEGEHWTNLAPVRDLERLRLAFSDCPSHEAGPAAAFDSKRVVASWRAIRRRVAVIHRRLQLRAGERLAIPAVSAQRILEEAKDQAFSYKEAALGLATPVLMLEGEFERLADDAEQLLPSTGRSTGWHSRAGCLWLRLRRLAALSYPLTPRFGALLWRSLRLPGLPQWLHDPVPQGVAPVVLAGCHFENDGADGEWAD